MAVFVNVDIQSFAIRSFSILITDKINRKFTKIVVREKHARVAAYI